MKEIEEIVIERKTSRPAGAPAGLAYESLLKETVSERERLLGEMHWWKSPVSEWPCYTMLCEKEEASVPELMTWLMGFERVGFLYEAEARFDNSGDNVLWASGKPFAHLEISELFYEADIRGIHNPVIARSEDKKRIVAPEVFSPPIQINLEFPTNVALKRLRQFINEQRESQSITQKRKSIPWKGLEAFDRKHCGLSHIDSDDDKPISRAREAYRTGNL